MGLHFRSVGKNVFVDGHERPDVVAQRQRFTSDMEGLKPYLVEFNADGTIREKTYPADCRVHGNQRRPIVIVTNDECTFNANDGITKAWIQVGDTFLRPKSRGQGIMVSEFLLPFSRPSLASCNEAVRNEALSAGLNLEATEYIEYGKSHDGYWDGAKLLEQLKHKALPLVERAFPGYSVLFLFDNATSHAIFADDALRVTHMNKGPGGKQPWLRDGYFYDADGLRVNQPMWFIEEEGQQDADGQHQQARRVQKGIQKVLEERGLGTSDLPLDCPRRVFRDCAAKVKCRREVRLLPAAEGTQHQMPLQKAVRGLH